MRRKLGRRHEQCLRKDENQLRMGVDLDSGVHATDDGAKIFKYI